MNTPKELIMLHFHSLILVLLATLCFPAAPSAPPAAPPGVGNPPLTITCPDIYKIFCGSPIDPSVAGTPTTTGGCPPITVSHVDIVTPWPCPADRFMLDIRRVWTATDSCGDSVSCEQEIHVLKQIWALDIKPPSCPNPIAVGQNGVVSIAILGEAGHDVSQIDPTSVQIWRESCVDGPAIPRATDIQDLGTPLYAGRCECHMLGADGTPDLRLRFSTQDLVNGLGLASLPDGMYVRLVVTARLYDGCEILAVDCIRKQQ